MKIFARKPKVRKEKRHIPLAKYDVKYRFADEFWAELADELLLAEVLAGEANPREFLKRSILEVITRFEVANLEDEIARTKEQSND